MGTNICNPSFGNNPFLVKDESNDNLDAEWAEVEKENWLLDIVEPILYVNSVDSFYKLRLLNFFLLVFILIRNTT
jgi:hypothetical protein